MDLVSMKIKKEKVEFEPPCEPCGVTNEYPYGLEVNLDKIVLDKLGIKVDNISVNSKCSLEAMGKITHISKNISERNDNASVTIQITDMALHYSEKKPKTLREVIGKVLDTL